MDYLVLENTTLKVSRLCMGGCPMGGYGWGSVREDELLAAIHAALDVGVNFFDTADTYGLGQSERTLAKGLGTHRKDAVIETKFGVRAGNGQTFYDNSPEYIRKALEGSLRRLNTDYVDVYTIHYRDGKTPIEDVLGELDKLKEAGKIRFFGLSNIHASGMNELRPYAGRFACCQDELSLACRKNEQDLLAARDILKTTPMTWGSLGQGILTGKYTKENIDFGADDRRSRDIYINFHGEKLDRNMQTVEVLRKIATERGKSISACAIRWILDSMPGSVVIAGIKRPAQIISNAEAVGWTLNSDELWELNEVSK